MTNKKEDLTDNEGLKIDHKKLRRELKMRKRRESGQVNIRLIFSSVLILAIAYVLFENEIVNLSNTWENIIYGYCIVMILFGSISWYLGKY